MKSNGSRSNLTGVSVNRRTLLGLSIQLLATGEILASNPFCKSDSEIDRWSIEKLKGVGPMRFHDSIESIVNKVGKPEDVFDFPGDPDNLVGWPPKLFYKYLSHGFMVEFQNAVVTGFELFTGHLAGYQTANVRSFPRSHDDKSLFQFPDLDAVLATFGSPSRTYELPTAYVPCKRLEYRNQGTIFEFASSTKRLSSIALYHAW